MTFQTLYYTLGNRVKDFDFNMKGIARFKENFPPFIVSENEDAYYVRALVPGLRLEDFMLTFKDSKLELSAEFQNLSSKYILQERAVGKFKRRISFSLCVVQDQIKSELKDGLLFIELPKEKGDKVEILTTDLAQTKEDSLNQEENQAKASSSDSLQESLNKNQKNKQNIENEIKES